MVLKIFLKIILMITKKSNIKKRIETQNNLSLFFLAEIFFISRKN